MEYQTIVVARKEHVATITLNRPEKLNAASPLMNIELADAFALVDQDDETRVVVMTGAGRAFCAGADVREGFQAAINRGEMGLGTDVTKGTGSGWHFGLADIKKPVIASINGLAIGQGCTMALVCDIRIASEAAWFRLGFTQMGVAPEFGSTYYLTRLVGTGKACELVFTNRMIDTKEAKEMGLVNQVVPADKLAEATYEIAGTIAKLPPQAIRVCKKELYQGMDSDLSTQLQFEAFVVDYLRGTEDFKEATKAFLEKREPVFKGR